MDLQVGGVSKFKVDKSGSVFAPASAPFKITANVVSRSVHFGGVSGASFGGIFSSNNGRGIGFSEDASSDAIFIGAPAGNLLIGIEAAGYYFTSGSSSLGAGGTRDLILKRDAANTLAQRNGVNAQTFRLYNTYTDASNYERVSLSWSGNAVTLAAEAGGTGTLRDLKVSAASYQLSSTAVITDATTARNLSSADNGRVIYFTTSSAVTVTAISGLGAGFGCTLIQGGLGQVTVSAGTGTSVVSYGSFTKTAGQYAAISVLCPVADTFYLNGDLA